jgi:omega-6 fatty acid desaturase (delta-12 desaturase)
MIPAEATACDEGRILQIRTALSACRIRRGVWATGVFLFDAILFLILAAAAVVARSHAARALASMAAGFQILRLASIAHDAGHLNYTGSRALDKMIARLAFLPALQPFGTWEIAHNVIHHSWTSIRGKDYVWIPKTKEEFDTLSFSRRSLERLYRSPWGHGFYYLIDLWLLRVLAPGLRWTEIRRPSHRLDIVLTGAFALGWGAAAIGGARLLGRNPAAALFYAEIAPFLVWCELFGLTLYLQHTHPRARFFGDRSEWKFYSSQAASATHIEFPRPFEWLLHGIFEHTAHHLDTSIPFYELHQAQRALNRVLSGTNVVYRWSWGEFLRCCRICKLYDYERQRWLA